MVQSEVIMMIYIDRVAIPVTGNRSHFMHISVLKALNFDDVPECIEKPSEMDILTKLMKSTRVAIGTRIATGSV